MKSIYLRWNSSCRELKGSSRLENLGDFFLNFIQPTRRAKKYICPNRISLEKITHEPVFSVNDP